MDTFSIHPDTTLGPVALTVSDMTRALRFYEGLLGLKTLQRADDTVALGTGSNALLVLLTAKARARPKPPRTTGLYHFAILLPSRVELARALQRLAAGRYPLQGVADHGVSEALYLADPDGNGIEIYIDRPREAWPWRDGQLQMVTDPLDVDELLAELRDDEDESSVPPATRVGHVHLHVSDLRQAERFYCQVLGFELVQKYPAGRGARSGPSALFVSAGGYHHHLGLNTWAGVGAPPPPPDAVGLRYFTIQLPDAAALAAVVERLQAADIPFERDAEGVRLGDPAGNGLLLVAAGF